MNKVQRTVSDNPVTESNCHYNTHIKRVMCCEQDPDLYAGVKQEGFFKAGVWKFICSKCGWKGGEGVTPNAASCCWNQELKAKYLAEARKNLPKDLASIIVVEECTALNEHIRNKG
jgi:hypothetical protein